MNFEENEGTGKVDCIVTEDDDACYSCLNRFMCPLIEAIQDRIVIPSQNYFPVGKCGLYRKEYEG